MSILYTPTPTPTKMAFIGVTNALKDPEPTKPQK